ncbi:hypothetical protein BBJ28_00013244 [Nothophytophthora sp. Chile5]|nr:hypothetical protein BBJ28_00013244 [Nothophytophthora sp. Chile5]
MAVDMAFVCKQCRKPFRKDLTVFEEEDERCPHCGNALILPVTGTVDATAPSSSAAIPS